jgi:hypothetical protein
MLPPLTIFTGASQLLSRWGGGNSAKELTT